MSNKIRAASAALLLPVVLVLGTQSAGAWKCEFHPEKPNCTPTTTVATTTVPETTVPDTTTTTSTTVPVTTTTSTTVPAPELYPPVSIERPIKFTG